MDDFERMAEFYGTALGFERTVDATSIGYAEFAAGDAILAIYDRARMTRVVGEHDAAGKGGSIITFDVTNVDAAFDQLVTAGPLRIAPPHDQPTWTLGEFAPRLGDAPGNGPDAGELAHSAKSVEDVGESHRGDRRSCHFKG